MNELREKIDNYMVEEQRSLIWIAEKCGISYSSLYKFKKGLRKLSNESLNKIIAFLEYEENKKKFLEKNYPSPHFL